MTEPAAPTPDLISALYQAVAGVFTIGQALPDRNNPGVIHLYGHFLVDTAEAYPILRGRFQTLGYTPLFREEEGRTVIRAIPGELPTTQRPRLTLALTLIVLTALSTMTAGMEWRPERSAVANVLSGWPFAVTLMLILLAHELGHYFVSRRLGIPTTLPYFIPLPLTPLGTMGALIQMKAPPQNRRHLLALGLAGPVAGLIVAIPALILGLSLSTVQPSPAGETFILEGNSILYALIKTAYFGYFLPRCGAGPTTFWELLHTALRGCPPGTGVDVFIHQVAYAGWAGLMVTGLNLVPAGTLDGGHIAYALFGRRARYVTWACVLAMALLSMLWIGWLLWVALILTIGRRSAVPLDDLTTLKPWQMAVAAAMLVVFLLTFSPVPLQVVGGP